MAGNSSILEEKIMKREIIEDKNIELSTLCDILTCKKEGLAELIASMKIGIEAVKFELIHKWVTSEQTPSQEAS